MIQLKSVLGLKASQKRPPHALRITLGFRDATWCEVGDLGPLPQSGFRSLSHRNHILFSAGSGPFLELSGVILGF